MKDKIGESDVMKTEMSEHEKAVLERITYLKNFEKRKKR